MKVLFACGGTAGHINPAIAIADLLKSRNPRLSVLFVGTPTGMENRLVRGAGYPIRHIPVKGLRRSLSPANLRAVTSLFRSFGAAGRILDEETPDLIVGTGGYVCYPTLREAAKRGIPTVLHESNARAGVASRLLARRTDLALINFPSAARDFQKSGKTVVSGNPLRREFYALNREAARKRLGIKPDALSLLVFGGSLGARNLNEAIEGAVPRLLSAYPTLSILHAVGRNPSGEDPVSYGRYERRSYIDDMPLRLMAADAVVCRAGAMTISEIAAAGVPSILVPFPRAAGDHQTKNALELVRENAAILIPDDALSPDVLFEKLSGWLSDPENRRRTGEAVRRFHVPDSGRIILREICTLCPKIVDPS